MTPVITPDQEGSLPIDAASGLPHLLNEARGCPLSAQARVDSHFYVVRPKGLVRKRPAA
jgi:hypothetical protein